MNRARQYFVLVCLMLLLGSFLFRLFYLQIISYARFSDIAYRQHNRVLKIEPRRGTIYDRNMEAMAINLDIQSIFCDPRSVTDKEATAEVLSSTLGVDKTDLLDKLQKDKSFIWVKRKVDSRTSEKVKALKLKGVHFITESKRNYPNENMASHVIGFVNVDNVGLEALELVWDEKLRGEPGWRHLVKDARQKTVLLKEEETIPAKNGYNIVLTVDTVIQYIAEDELKKMVKKFNADGGSVVVLDPYNGKILAMANYPNFNLNKFAETPRSMVKNAAVCDVYEPGSIFKIVTASAALNEGVVSLTDRFDCEMGEYAVAGRVLHDYHPYGMLPFLEVIGKSSNIGTVKVAHKLGSKRLYEYIIKFGFGSKTGVDMPGEVPGINRPAWEWTRSDITTVPIGQGIAVTSLQLACAVGVVANGGYLIKPYIVDKITTWEGGIYKKFEPTVVRKVLEKETCVKMKKIMKYVVSDGTGKPANSKYYYFGGKTGTAQMVNPQGGYYTDRYDASFIGFAPVDKPAVVIVVTAKNPHPIHFGGSVAAPAFKGIAERTLQYLGIKPEKEVPSQTEKLKLKKSKNAVVKA
ncbi:MAG: penicillin-binding transpeptidase domain-containing protein [Candidatus Omnitrophica bacterium]|nr:penicillin-binding transpeptidase domain-containing protein [Candidatus Omnitrophota bacterium]